MTIEATLERIATALESLVAAKGEAPAAAPKASRAKKTDTAAEPSTVATAEATAGVAITAATASPSSDMFAEGASSPKDSTAPVTPDSSKASKSPPAAEKSKAPTLDEVRAAMVDVQTKCGGKAAAQGLLVQFTTDKKPLYSALPEEKYGALIAACKELVAKAK
jgi:hypothetical protein